MPEQVFVIVRDARGSLVHVRRRDNGECMGCIEVGLYEIVRMVIAEEVGETAHGDENILGHRHTASIEPRGTVQ